MKDQYNEVQSHRQNEWRVNRELDFINDNDEPSTSGSYQAINQVSNGNSPICLTPPFYNLNLVNGEDNGNNDLFKETAHFFRCETEVRQQNNQDQKSHSIVKSDIQKQSKSNPRQISPLTIRNSGRGMKTNEKTCTTLIPPEKPSLIKEKKHIQSQRPKSVLGKSRPLTLIKTQQVFTKELVSLIDNVPKEYIEDPEIKQGLNILLKNLKNFKQVINSKKSLINKRKRDSKPLTSYKRVITKKDNNKPIKIVNTHKKLFNH